MNVALVVHLRSMSRLNDVCDTDSHTYVTCYSWVCSPYTIAADSQYHTSTFLNIFFTFIM